MCSRRISVPTRYTSKCHTDSHAVEKPFPTGNGKQDSIPYVMNDALCQHLSSNSIYTECHHITSQHPNTASHHITHTPSRLFRTEHSIISSQHHYTAFNGINSSQQFLHSRTFTASHSINSSQHLIQLNHYNNKQHQVSEANM